MTFKPFPCPCCSWVARCSPGSWRKRQVDASWTLVHWYAHRKWADRLKGALGRAAALRSARCRLFAQGSNHPSTFCPPARPPARPCADVCAGGSGAVRLHAFVLAHRAAAVALQRCVRGMIDRLWTRRTRARAAASPALYPLAPLCGECLEKVRAAKGRAWPGGAGRGRAVPLPASVDLRSGAYRQTWYGVPWHCASAKLRPHRRAIWLGGHSTLYGVTWQCVWCDVALRIASARHLVWSQSALWCDVAVRMV